MAVFQLKDKNGKKSGPWYAKYPIGRLANGKIHYQQRKIGYSKRIAERVDAKNYEEFKQKEMLGISHETPVRKTFGELVDWYVELESVKAKRTYRDMKRLALRLKTVFGQLLASKITPADIENYMYKRLKDNVCRGRHTMRTKVRPGSVNREISIMRRIYNLAIKNDLVERNPVFKVEFLNEQNKRDRVISHDEYQSLVIALPQYAADVVKTAYWTGMRAGEIFGLTWDRVDLERNCITLEPKDTKTKEPRTIFLNDELLEVFTRRARVRSIVHNRVFTFPQSNRPLTTVRHSFKRACRNLGIEDFRLHDIRHTFNTNMRKSGVPESVIMKMTGHRSRAMFDRYNTVSREDARLALGKLDEYLKISNIVQNDQKLVDMSSHK